MISASFSRTVDGFSLSMRGHANYAPTGSGRADIVCAAVSGIFYALVGYLANSGEDCDLSRIRHGHADVDCSKQAEEAMKQTCIGFIQIQNTYPECVRVHNGVWEFPRLVDRESASEQGRE